MIELGGVVLLSMLLAALVIQFGSRKCPACRESVPRRATVCRACRSLLTL